MIENLPDAISQVVSNMKHSYSVVSAGSVPPSPPTGTLTLVNYTSGKNQLSEGMYIEFPVKYPNRRYKITTFTDLGHKSYQIVLDSNVTGLEAGDVFNLFLNYYYGHPKEIQQDIIDLIHSNRKNHQTPLLALFLDYEEIRGGNSDVIFETKANLAFIIDAQKKWRSDTRLTNSFKQCLHPLYYEFIKAVNQSSLFETEDNVDNIHSKTDRYYYSADEAAKQNTMAVIADAIEIKNLQLTLLEQTTC